ncbi:SRPBCC family protein [Alkalinema pantanalense CENA528]|uniref:SRPBCC family protein n=1 Tax=Alkalinema pantanalense TaxID=1620705 RepID=UPI003D6E0987
MVATPVSSTSDKLSALLQGEILLETRPYSAWGGAVTAKMYIPAPYTEVWQQLTDYSRWTAYFPDIHRSEVIHNGINTSGATVKRQIKRLYQAASKAFLFFTAQVEVYLKVLETHHQRIQFFMESGNFNDFSADLELQAWGEGTIVTYSVQATPTIPVPSAFIQEAIKMDLPNNMEQMRRVICKR